MNIKLEHLDKWNERRREIANRYLNEIKNPNIVLPTVKEENVPVWHIFAIRSEKRKELIQYLSENGIGTMIHYPIPIHLQKAYEDLGYQR